MRTPGRPRIVTDAAIIEAGVRITLPNVTVRAIAAELGVSEMSVYRRTGGLDALRLLIADGIVARADFTVPDRDDPEDAIIDLAHQLRDFVLKHPGIAAHLADLGAEARGTLQRVEQAQTAFAARYGLTPAQASILVSTVAENAVALSALNLRSHREARNPGALDNATPTIRAGAAAAANLSPAERFSWSIRAAARGTMSMLGLPVRADTHLPNLDRSRQ